MSIGNGNGQPQQPRNVISAQAMAAAKSGQMKGPAIDICGEKNEHRNVVWPIPGQRDAIIIPFAEFKAVFSQLLQVELQIDARQAQAQLQAPKIIVPQLDVRKIDLRREH